MAKKLNDEETKPTKSSKAKSKNKVEPNIAAEDRPTKCVCQYCKNHKNNPSLCKLTNKYIGRKTPGCKNFK